MLACLWPKLWVLRAPAMPTRLCTLGWAMTLGIVRHVSGSVSPKAPSFLNDVMAHKPACAVFVARVRIWLTWVPRDREFSSLFMCLFRSHPHVGVTHRDAGSLGLRPRHACLHCRAARPQLHGAVPALRQRENGPQCVLLSHAHLVVFTPVMLACSTHSNAIAFYCPHPLQSPISPLDPNQLLFLEPARRLNIGYKQL